MVLTEASSYPILAIVLVFAGTIATAAFSAWQTIKAQRIVASVGARNEDRQDFTTLRDTWATERKEDKFAIAQLKESCDNCTKELNIKSTQIAHMDTIIANMNATIANMDATIKELKHQLENPSDK